MSANGPLRSALAIGATLWLPKAVETLVDPLNPSKLFVLAQTLANSRLPYAPRRVVLVFASNTTGQLGAHRESHSKREISRV